MGSESPKVFVKNFQTFLKNNLNRRYSLPRRVDNPSPCDYSPNKDVSLLLEPHVATFYVQLIAILRWKFELGRINICTEVSILFSYSTMLHDQHLKTALHNFSFLKSKSNLRLIFDKVEPDFGKSD